MKQRTQLVIWLAVAVVAALSVVRFATEHQYLLAFLNATVVMLFLIQAVMMLGGRL